jgi:hypothetical protein
MKIVIDLMTGASKNMNVPFKERGVDVVHR